MCRISLLQSKQSILTPAAENNKSALSDKIFFYYNSANVLYKNFIDLFSVLTKITSI
jgi:hypothetical protein